MMSMKNKAFYGCALSCVASVALSVGSALAAPSTDASSAADGPRPQVWAKRETGYFQTADGTRLRYSALLPAKKGKFPVALIYSGYDTGSIGGPAYMQNNVTFSASLDETLLRHGYAVVGVNARATGCSEGKQFTFVGSPYGEDGRDAVEFAAQAPWSNGNVGMYGWSWSGMSQLATAPHRPPHLKAIAPGMVVGDPRLDNSAPGGVTAYHMANAWRQFVHSRWEAARISAEAEHDDQCLEQLKRNYQTEDKTPWALEAIRHPLRDAWNEEQRLSAHAQEISVPVLSMEAFQDEATTPRGDYYQEKLDPNKTWLFQSNGPHDLYESAEWRKILVAFFDRFVKGDSNGFDNRPHLLVWMETQSEGKGEHSHVDAARPGWQFTEQALIPTVTPVSFSLSQGGQLLDGEPGHGDADSYVYPTPGPTLDVGFSDDWGPMAGSWKQGSLAYTSAPLTRDILAYGSASVDLWVSSSEPDIDLQVTLTEVRPDGQERLMQRGWLRMSDRALDDKRSKPVRPVLLDRPETMQLLNPDEPVLARVEINKFATLLRKGSRLRVWIDAPSDTGEYQFSYVTWRGKNRIWHDAAHPSRVVLGEIQGVNAPGEAAPCGTALKLACRRDPLAGS
jgi:putative CocE/NonD family hydrolase